MTHNQRIFCLLAVALCGCTAASTAGKPAKKTPTKSPPLNIDVAGYEGQIFQPDPKLPGKYLWQMYVKSAYGMSQDNGFAGKLSGVKAVLYQHGVASAVMTAPTASGNNKTQVIVATGPGRTKVRSLTEPGTTLDADKMTWYARTNKIVAEGHVIYHNGKSGLIMRVSRLNADTVLKSVSFGKGTGLLPQGTR